MLKQSGHHAGNLFITVRATLVGQKEPHNQQKANGAAAHEQGVEHGKLCLPSADRGDKRGNEPFIWFGLKNCFLHTRVTQHNPGQSLGAKIDYASFQAER